jgi:hypothetical protein
MISARQVVALALVVVFVALALLHAYWAFGGTWGARVAVPEVNKRLAFRPGRAATLVVAGLLLAAAIIITLKASALPRTGGGAWIVSAGAWTLTAVFALRAIGDFDRLGVFRVARATAFATYDAWLFTPLCIALSVGCGFVALGG